MESSSYQNIFSKKKFFLLIILSFFFINPSFYSQQITIPTGKKQITNEYDYTDFRKMHYKDNFTQSVDSNLTLLSQLGIGPCYDAVPRDNYLFVGNGALFQVLDVSDPENPFVIGEVLTETGNISDIELYGDYAIFVYPFTVVNIANPENPFIVYSGSFGMSELYLDDHYAFIDVPAGVRIVDIEDP